MELLVNLVVIVVLAALLIASVISAWRWWDVYVEDKKLEREKLRLELANGCVHKWKNQDMPVHGQDRKIPYRIDHKLTCEKCGEIKYVLDPLRGKA